MVAALLLGGRLGGWAAGRRVVEAFRLVAAMAGDYFPAAENKVAFAVTPTACLSWGER